jgi:Uma2 family endonuclease
MAMLTKPMTADDLLRLPSGRERHELVRGELRTMSPASFEHGRIGTRLLTRLACFVSETGLGVVVGPDTGFVLQRDPDLVRSPDVSFVVASRVPQVPLNRFFPGAPDLAIDVLSPSDTVDEVEEKLSDFFAAGTRSVWIIKPRTKSVDVWTAGKLSHSLASTDLLTHPDLLPGFECPVGSLFAAGT